MPDDAAACAREMARLVRPLGYLSHLLGTARMTVADAFLDRCQDVMQLLAQ